MIRWLIFVLLFVACGKGESEELKRAKELMSIGEWSNARTELKIRLKASPDDTDARALLLYCVARLGDLKAPDVDQLELLPLYGVLHEVTSPTWESSTNAEVRDTVSKQLVKLRQALYDQGVDTKDPNDLASVVLAAARWAFENDDDTRRKDQAAAILAIADDRAARDHLTQRLKSQEPREATAYIVRAGAPMLPALKQAIADPGFLGRDAALDALAQIQAAMAARTFTEKLALRYPDSDRGSDFLSKNFIRVRELAGTPRVHASYQRIEGGAIDGVLLLQSHDSAAKEVDARVFAFTGGELRPLSTVKQGKAFRLGGESVVFGLKVKAPGRVTVHRLRERSVTRDVDDGAVMSPTIGMRVRLRGHAPVGQIVREDEGLWVVRVDKPISGMTELPVAASALIALRKETFTESTLETITGKVVGDSLEIETVEEGGSPDDVVLSDEDPWDQQSAAKSAVATMERFQRNMCRCVDKACADKVNESMTKWGTEMAKTAGSNREEKPDPQLANKAADIMTKYTDCMTRLMMAGL